MSYEALSRAALEKIQQSGRATVLAVESSCDETAAAVVKDGREVCSNIIFSQIDLHAVYGGVVPEIASRSHVEKIGGVVAQALAQADCAIEDLDAVAVTSGPGLVGCLLAGVSYAKGLALAQNLPLIGVHHILGHICANLIAFPDLQPPFLCLVASGGHSHLIAVNEEMRCRVLGRTRDDAAGEAFDKVARALGLPYPGGPELEKLAQSGDSWAFSFPSGFHAGAHYDFSFSGMKTSVMNLLHNARQKEETLECADVAASFQRAVVEVLAGKAVRAAQEQGYHTVALAGGVAANAVLRSELQARADAAGLRFVCPPMPLCTDNAAMIGCAAYYLLMRGETDDLSLNARASWDLEKV